MSKKHPRVVVLWGFNTHVCTACAGRFEWGGGVQAHPTAEQLSVCPKCGDGPLRELTMDERKAEAK